jgi:hypothetical protein
MGGAARPLLGSISVTVWGAARGHCWAPPLGLNPTGAIATCLPAAAHTATCLSTLNAPPSCPHPATLSPPAPQVTSCRGTSTFRTMAGAHRSKALVGLPETPEYSPVRSTAK